MSSHGVNKLKTNAQLSCELVWVKSQVKERDWKISNLKKRLERMAGEIDNIPNYKSSGWFILLGKDPAEESGFKFLGFFNPTVTDEFKEPEWDICLPIPVPETMKEFQGW